jgi:tyrosyl-tRNA synthetase
VLHDKADHSSVKNRLNTDQGISFTEFSYQLLQAHDFSHLYSTHDCRVQLGGSDQWGNIVAGIDLIRRTHSAPDMASGKKEEGQSHRSAREQGILGERLGQGKGEAYGLTIPLLTTSSGEKFGKSAGNAVWLDEGRTSVSDFYQVGAGCI